jgi:hypothetical protein
MREAKSSVQKLGYFCPDAISSVLSQRNGFCAEIGVLLVTGEKGVG